ncbi:hypothetical protein JKP88DRAFT_260994 [Tribonema minus]|uniref:Uncharacterized protein n=1 Tax=Tribonema minus TaxID=303371 RepID=A0A835Z5H7_9STRA|nr:hypothetical protein JKP88DRAFT_260994 [Tribonema minus]
MVHTAARRLELWLALGSVLAAAAAVAVQTITVEAETCTAPTYDRTPDMNTGGSAGRWPFGIDVTSGGDASGGKSMGFAWSMEYYSYDVVIPRDGFYLTEFFYGTLKSEAQVLGPRCLWEDCKSLPDTFPWRVSVYARLGPCSKFADPNEWAADRNPLPGSWNALNCQVPGFGGADYVTLLPKSFFGNTASFTDFGQLTSPLPRWLRKGQHCVQVCNGWDINSWDRLKLTRVDRPPEGRARCGDGECVHGENCQMCPDDCGACYTLHPPLTIGDVPANFFYAWAFDKANVDGLSPYMDTSKGNSGGSYWRPDAPDVDVDLAEISVTVSGNDVGEYQSFSVWVGQAGPYRAGVHYSTNDAKGGVQRLALRMGKGACKSRTAPYSCAENALPDKWTEVLRPAFATTPETTLGEVGGLEQGKQKYNCCCSVSVQRFRTVYGTSFTLASTGTYCVQTCVLDGDYSISRYVFKHLAFDAAAVTPNPNGKLPRGGGAVLPPALLT